MGSLIDDGLRNILQDDLLCDAQHGFRWRISFQPSFTEFMDWHVEAIDRGIQLDVTPTEVFRVFDRMIRRWQLEGLQEIRLSENLITWVSHSLRNQKFLVGLNGSLFNSFDFPHPNAPGVHIGPKGFQ